MIVDVHCHLWDSPNQLGPDAAARLRRRAIGPWDSPDASPEAFEQAMEPVAAALILGLWAERTGTQIPNESIARYVQRNPRKYIGFAGIDPMSQDCLAELDRARSLGLAGVTLSPSSQGFHPTHSRAMALFEACQAHKMPVFIHNGHDFSAASMLEFGPPYLLDEVARVFPELTLVIGQVGHPWVEQTFVLLDKHERVFADVSNVAQRPWQLYNTLLSAHQQEVIDRLLLGSNFPFATPEQVISAIYSVNSFAKGSALPSVPRELLRSIVERDALACLGLELPAETPTAPPPPAKPAAADTEDAPGKDDSAEKKNNPSQERVG